MQSSDALLSRSANEPATITSNYDDSYEVGEIGHGDIEVNVEEYLRILRHPKKVTLKNKIICTTAFVVLIIAIGGYVAGLAYTHAKSDIMSDLHFKSPTDIIYFLMLSDLVASVVGIWTSLKRTGPQPMIYACIWLLLSSLINLCVTISLTFETRSFRKEKNKRCKTKTSDECKVYTIVSVVLWCSLLTISLKIIVIILCRINYPQVFNWMMGKDVYVDEDLLPLRNPNIISSAGTLGGAYFEPPNIARIAARGSLVDTMIVGNTSDSPAIFVTKKTNNGAGIGRVESGEMGDEMILGRIPSKRRSTFVSVI